MPRVQEAFEGCVNALSSPLTVTLARRSLAWAAVIGGAFLASLFSSASFLGQVPSIAVHHPVWLQYGHSRPPYAVLTAFDGKQELAQHQAYDVTLELLLPVSKRNLDVGNFMVHLDLYSKSNVSLMWTSRPALLEYKPTTIRLFRAVLSPKVLLGLSSTRQTLHVPLARNQVLYSRTPVHHALIEVGRKDTYLDPATAQSREVQVDKATLHFHAHFTGLRYILYHYRYTSFAVLSAMFFAAMLSSALASWGLVLFIRSQKEESRAAPPAKPVVDAKPSKEALLRQIRLADEAAAADAKRAQVSQGPSMSQETVLSALKKEPTETEEDVLSEDSADSWQQADREALKEEELDSKWDDTHSVGGSTTTAGSSSTFGTLRSGSSTASTVI